MRASFFKIEENEELIDVMNLRVVERNEIEIFSLTQLIGLMELLERKIILTSQCRKSMLAFSFVGELEDMGTDEDLLELLYEAVYWRGQIDGVTDEIAEQAKVLKERLIDELDVRLKAEQEDKAERRKFYDFSVKQLRHLHEETRRSQMEDFDC